MPIDSTPLQRRNIERFLSFKYDIDDGYGTTQEREEVKDDQGNVKGSYGYMDANGIFRKVVNFA